jgi:S-adenosylmethionine decarboxylase
MKSLGRHLLVEFYDCNSEIINDLELVEKYMNEAALAAGSTIIKSVFHRFQPFGVSGVVVIAESHLAIHTWPEYNYASVDLYTCGACVEPIKAYLYLKEKFQARAAELKEFPRGDIDTILSNMKDKKEKPLKKAANDSCENRGVVL